MNKNIMGMSSGFLRYLEDQYWKGNIRELKNVIERAVILSDQEMLQVEDLPFEFQFVQHENNHSLSLLDLASVEKTHIQRILHFTKGNKAEAARLLNIGLTTIYRKMEAYGIRYPPE